MLTQSDSLRSASTLFAITSTSSSCACTETLPPAAISFIPALCTNKRNVFPMLANNPSVLAIDKLLPLVMAVWRPLAM
ncbi:hypothetical protein IA69_13010 [Massilia sp. JS1662]|nr:hypothetical protein IA69_13010 [Massilia sp. JS1662]